MYNYIKEKVRTWFSLGKTPPGFFQQGSEINWWKRPESAACIPQSALGLSPYYAALRIYQTTLASLPLVTYQKDSNGGRKRLADRAKFNLLHERPNPAMSRAVFFEYCIKELFNSGNCYVLIQWSNNNRPIALFPIPTKSVKTIYFDDDWKKTYIVDSGNGKITEYFDHEIIHVYNYSENGFVGMSFLEFAGQSLNLHKQVLNSATSYYRNAAKPSGYIRFPGKLQKEAIDNVKTNFKDDFAGTDNTGKIPVLTDGGEYNQFPNTNASDAQIVEALNSSVTDIARWFNLSPLILGDLSRGTYSNLAADNLAFYQRSLRPLLDKFELEINNKLFGSGEDIYCEFLVEAILRADPTAQAAIWHSGITDGYITRGEVRQWLNLPPIFGLDQPIALLNMGNPNEQTNTSENQNNNQPTNP